MSENEDLIDELILWIKKLNEMVELEKIKEVE